MTIWAIADLHASRTDPITGRATKPMDAFGAQWTDHMDKLEAAWAASVEPQDTVIIVGDIDWALHLADALETLQRIASWNGQSVLVRGNHDYWWSSKATNRVRQHLPPGLHLLHNDAFMAEGFNICGTKGSPVPGAIDWKADNDKLLNRERHRLLLSLSGRDVSLPTIAALHYPPFYPAHGPSPYTALLTEHRVLSCVYGHLHGDAALSGPKGCYDGVEYRLVAGDYVDFRLVPIATEGKVLKGSR